ncbi:hypothetical protein JW916_01405 [Candidatus Sumerlaeota bacterium]|nr:hypothetical protein [Candidatus Sumerlaeota bacterium]
MKAGNLYVTLLIIAVSMVVGCLAQAQDNVTSGAEPIVQSIDVATLAYDFLVDGNLAQDDPANKKFKTLQAAYEAAPAGTEEKPTVIGIRPNVYPLPSTAPRTPSLRIAKDYITFLGLTDNRRSVVLADNRGFMQGGDDNGYILDVDATGFTCKNLTVLNYCNVDYEYPGDPGKNLTKRSDVITQAVALQASGDKHVYENVAVLSRLDTMFLRTRRSYFKNVYIEGTDDWIGGGQISVWEDCTLVFPTGQGVMLAVNVVFHRCRFEATDGMRFYKVGFGSHQRPSALIDCVVPVNTPEKRVAWMRESAPPRPTFYSLTHNVRDINGDPTRIYDSAVGEPTFDHSRELSDRELSAFNPWNLLRAVPGMEPDDWDPAGVKDKYEAAGQGNLPFRIELNDGSNPSRSGGGGRPALPRGSYSVRTGEPGVTIGATVTPVYATDPTITWSTQSDLISLSGATGPDVVVTGRNQTDQAEWVSVNATASNGFFVTAWVYVEPAYTEPPAVLAKPTLIPPAGGTVGLDYTLDLGGKEDRSLVSWSICDDAEGTNAREIAVGRGDPPMKTLESTPGYVGKFIQVDVTPKLPFSHPGATVSAIATSPIEAADITSTTVSPNFRYFVVTPNDSFMSGLWTVTGTWRSAAGEEFENGYGVGPEARTSATLLYQNDADCGDMRIDLLLTPEKTAGQLFSAPGSPDDTVRRGRGHADFFIKYDPRTRNGYSLRVWRTTQSHAKVMCQFYKIVDGAGSPLNDKQVLTGVFKPNTHLTIKAVGTTLTASASNTKDEETLSLEGTIEPNRFGGTGMYWPGGTAAVCSRYEISYPDASSASAEPPQR